MSNPLLSPSPLPYSLPDYASIQDQHFLPAFQSAMTLHREEVEKIRDNSAPATFENTFLAWEQAGQEVRWCSAVFFTLLSADGTEVRHKIAENIQPQLAEHSDSLFLMDRLFDRFIELDLATLNGEELRLAEEILRQFRHNGAELGQSNRELLIHINQELAVLSTQYGRAMIQANNDHAVYFDQAADLVGLSQSQLDSSAEAALKSGHTEGYVLELSMFTSQPWLALLEKSESRRRVFEAAYSRGNAPGETNTSGLSARIAHLRARKARLLGYETFAEYALQDRTAPSLHAVDELLCEIIVPAMENARREQRVLENFAGHTLQPWDVPFFSARYARENLSVDSSKLSEFFELERVLEQGVFAAATALYGITLHERKDLKGYHPQVRVWEVLDADGQGLGLFLGDFFTRSSKSGGAWMNSLRVGSREFNESPIVVNNLNLISPAAGSPCLLSLDEVVTLFHEFGHALHGLFGDARFASLSATSVPRDFVEYPSQVNELWATWPELVKNYAQHYLSGEELSSEILVALEEASSWGQGYATAEYLGATMLDLAWHRLSPHDQIDDVLAFEHRVLLDAGLDPHLVPPRYRSTYFKHIFSGGYAAGYYSYLWAEVLDADSIEWFREHGGLSRKAGEHFRSEVLSQGNTRDPLESYRRFRGRNAKAEPLLKRRGLSATSS